MQSSTYNRDISFNEHCQIGDIAKADLVTIKTIKFYMKCPDLETLDSAPVTISYNSDLTGKVSTNHDLKDGLILELPIESLGGTINDISLFDVSLYAAEGVFGTYSVELLNSDGLSIGIPIYAESATPIETYDSLQTTSSNSFESTASTTTTPTAITNTVETTTTANATYPTPVNTGVSDITSLLFAAAVSAAIISATFKKR